MICLGISLKWSKERDNYNDSKILLYTANGSRSGKFRSENSAP
jgi:hypothetical protein